MSHDIITTHLNGEISVSNNEYTYESVKYIGAKFSIELSLNKKLY